MPLVIHLRKDQKAILNGAVIENVSGRTISIAVKNEAKVLRSDDVLEPESAVTPASRLYFALQCAYLFPERTAQHLAAFQDYLSSYLAAAPSAATITVDVVSAIDAGNLYAALKSAQALIHHEGKVLSHGESRPAEELQRPAVTRQSTAHGGLGIDSGSASHESGTGGG